MSESVSSTNVAAAEIYRARMYVVFASLLWSLSGFFVKSDLFREWPGEALAFWRAVFAGLAVLPFVRRPAFSLGLIPMTLCFAGMSFTYVKSMSLMPKELAGCSLWMQCTAPSWVLLVGVFVLGEKAGVRDWIMIGLSALGVGVMLAASFSAIPPLALALALASAWLYSGIVISLRRLRHHDPAWLGAINQCVTAIALSPFAWNAMQGVHPEPKHWFMLAAFGSLQLGIPYILFAKAVKSLPGHEASALTLLEPLLLPVWIYLASGVSPDPLLFVAGGFIFLGLLIRYWPWKIEPAPAIGE